MDVAKVLYIAMEKSYSKGGKKTLILVFFLLFLAVQVAIPAAGRRRVALPQILSSRLFPGLQALQILYE